MAAGCREQSAFGAIAETVAKRRAEGAKRPRVLNLDEAAKRYSTSGGTSSASRPTVGLATEEYTHVHRVPFAEEHQG
jgi:hypothetical protein